MDPHITTIGRYDRTKVPAGHRGRPHRRPVRPGSPEPAVIYDTAGNTDKSFNEAVFRNGVEVYNKDKGVKVKGVRTPERSPAREQGLRRLASRGNGPIVAVGFNMGSSRESRHRVPEHPVHHHRHGGRQTERPVPHLSKRMKVPSWWVPWQPSPPRPAGRLRGRYGHPADPQVPSAAMSKSAKYINPKIDVHQNMTGSTPAASPTRPRGRTGQVPEFAKAPDVVYAAGWQFDRCLSGCQERRQAGHRCGIPTRTTCNRAPC